MAGTLLSLEGKVAIITGAGSGIGLATAKAFVTAGVQGLALVDLSQSALTKAFEAFTPEEQSRLLCVPADISTEQDTIRYVKETVDKFGHLDITVQCAGIGAPDTPLVETDVAVFDKILAVNTRGSFLGMKHSVKAMLASPSKGKGCSVVLISSQLGLDGGPFITPYVASKFAVRGMVSAASQELGVHGIRVNAVCPGPINTPLWLDSMTPDERVAWVDRASLKRPGEAEEVAQGILFLASPSSSLMTGASMKMDGGWSRWV